MSVTSTASSSSSNAYQGVPVATTTTTTTQNTEGEIFAGLPQPFQKTGYIPTKHYISSNEEKQSQTLQLLNGTSNIAEARRVHLGFAVWFNWDLISVSKPAYAIICDIDDCVIEVYEAIAGFLLESDSSSIFYLKFQEYLRINKIRLFGDLSDGDAKKEFDLEAEYTRPDSWLSDETRFRQVKMMHENHRILYLNLNVMDQTDKFEGISQWLNDRNLELDTLYVSNIIEWPHTLEQGKTYIDNLKKVATANTRFIQAFKPDLSIQGHPIQHLGRGEEAIIIPERKSLQEAKATRRRPEGSFVGMPGVRGRKI